MKNKTMTRQKKGIYLFLMCVLFSTTSISSQNVKITINLRGVAESKISLLPLVRGRAEEAKIFKNGVKNGETAILLVDKKDLPMEFVVRYDYKTKPEDTPYPSEQHIFVNNQDLSWSVNPPYCNNQDSLKFQDGEIENTLMRNFEKENATRKGKIGVLQQFLFSYDDVKSKLFKDAFDEYEKRRNTYNDWLKEQTKKNKGTFVSSTFCFQYAPPTTFSGDEKENLKNIISHYFDGIDFNDANLIRTANINKFMDTYVNMNAQLMTKNEDRDSLFSAIAVSAIEKTKSGNPYVYGWMVDYFYEGFESNSMDKPMKVLLPYTQDPNCKTKKQRAIEKRLEGMRTLVVGSITPDIELNANGNKQMLHSIKTTAKYKLLVFWSADCSHCAEEISELYPYYQKIKDDNLIDVIAFSLDETAPEIQKWEEKRKDLVGWSHFRGESGINSKAAAAYFILATPVMIVIDSETNMIVSLPLNVAELKKFLR